MEEELEVGTNIPLNIIINSNKNSGFFIDEQLACDSLCWSLKAQKLSGSGLPVESDPWSELLLKGLIVDETPTVKIDVNHSYQSGGGVKKLNQITNWLGDAFDSYKHGRAYAEAAVGATKGLLDKFEATRTASDFIDDVKTTGNAKLNEWTNGLFSKVDNYSKGSLMLGTKSLRYYDGTTVNITIPSIRIRYYHNMYNGVSVKDLVKSLNNRLIGNYASVSDTGSSIGIMEPPNGFFSTGTDVVSLGSNNPKTGTFLITYGGIEFPNLICNRYSIELSTTKIKYYDALGNSNTTDDYLYADIDLSFEPIAIMTRDNINSLINIS